MKEPITNNDQSKEEKQKAFWQRARQGVLRHLMAEGGKLPMSSLHDFSMSKFFIGHQGFSQMMESFVSEGLVEFNWEHYEATITDTGRKFISGQ